MALCQPWNNEGPHTSSFEVLIPSCPLLLILNSHGHKRWGRFSVLSLPPPFKTCIASIYRENLKSHFLNSLQNSSSPLQTGGFELPFAPRTFHQPLCSSLELLSPEGARWKHCLRFGLLGVGEGYFCLKDLFQSSLRKESKSEGADFITSGIS